MSDINHEIFDLKKRVKKLESQITFLLRNLDLEHPEPDKYNVSPEIIDLVRKGKKIKATKLFRLETGLGLKEAKEFIESLET